MAAITLSQRVRHIIGDAFGASIVEQTLEKALQRVKERATQPDSLFYDPVSLFTGYPWLSKSQLQATYTDLRAMTRNPIISAIIGTRLNQVAAFCRVRQKDYELGFQVVSDDDRANKDEETKAAIQDWVSSMGVIGFGEPMLEQFARKFLFDSLCLDQACAEVVYRRNDQPAYAVVVDAATIRRLKASLDFQNQDPDEPHYVQIMHDQIVASYGKEDLIFAVRNPRTDIKMMGYGYSELETLLRTVSAIINGEKYNSGMLTQGATQKGVLVVKGEGDLEQFNIFKRDFREAIRNAAQAWRPPVLRISKDSDVNWVALDRSNRDMEYAQLFDFLVKEACGVFQMDPSEINWAIGQQGAQVVFQSNQKIQQLMSRERGLRPLVTFFQNILNTWFVKKLDPRYRLEFAGFGEDRQTDVDIISKEVTTFRTVNEVRAGKNLDPLEGGDIILSPVYAQMQQAEKQAEMQQAGGMGRAPGGDEEDENDIRSPYDEDEDEK